MTGATHRVARLTVEMVAADRRLADRLADRAAAAAPMIADLLDRGFDAADDGRRYRIDRLVLALPRCDPARFEESLLVALDRALAEALPRRLAITPAVDAVEDALDLVAAVAGTGSSPWWAPERAPLAAAVEALATAGAAAADGIRFVLALPDAPARLARSVPAATLARLVAAALGVNPDVPAALALRLAAAAPDADPAAASHRAWTTLLRRAAGPRPATSTALGRDLGIAPASRLRTVDLPGSGGSEAGRTAMRTASDQPFSETPAQGEHEATARPAAAHRRVAPHPQRPSPIKAGGDEPRRSPRGPLAAARGEQTPMVESDGQRPVSAELWPAPTIAAARVPASPAFPTLVDDAGSYPHRDGDSDQDLPEARAVATGRYPCVASAPSTPPGDVAGSRTEPTRGGSGQKPSTTPPAADSRPAPSDQTRSSDMPRMAPDGGAPDDPEGGEDPPGGDPIFPEIPRSIGQAADQPRAGRATVSTREDDGAGSVNREGDGSPLISEATMVRAPRASPVAPGATLVRDAGLGHDALYLDNAGMILLWPFFPRLLAAAGLLDVEGRLGGDRARGRAAMLLDHLVTGDRDPPETTLALPKLLAGLPVDGPFDPGPPLTDTESGAAAATLSAALDALPMLGRIGIGGLRTAWLARPARLAVEHGGWSLRIERRSWDVLLARVPWPLAVVALPWMPDPVRVEW